MTTAIIVAAGKSTRMGENVDKMFLSLVAKPVVAWSLLAFEKCRDIDRIILVVRKEQLLACKAVVKMFGISKIDKIVAGGARRCDSVQAGLKACDLDTKYVVIHDGARPLITPDAISEVVKLAKRYSSVTIAHPMIDTVKRCDKGITVTETVPREKLWQAQTPQAFQMSILRDAYKKLPPKTDITDDCLAVEKVGGDVKVVEWHKPNFKITHPEDLELASRLLR